MRRIESHVVMVGPALNMQGGIAAVVNGLIDGGLGDVCDLHYVATVCKGSSPRKALKFFSAVEEFRRALKAADIVHVHASVRGSFRRKREIARLTKAAGKSLVLHEHSGEFAEIFESEGDRYREQVREFFGWADVVVVLSSEWREYFASNVCDRSKIVVMHNAVVLPSVKAEPRNHQDVLFLGKLGPCKSPDVLLRAAKILSVRFPEVRFRFAGDGDIDRYRTLSKELGVEAQCEFMGWVKGEDKEQTILETGVFCLPSRHEGMPMSLLEMMSYGLPCVATPVGGVPQVIKDEENGRLVSVGDPEALAECLSALLSSPVTREKLGSAAYSTVVRDFDVKRNVQLLGDLYRGLKHFKQ